MTTLLHLTATGPQYWRRQRGHWQRLDAPPGTPRPVWVVTDLAEETLVDIDIPRLYGANRNILLERQLATRFPDTPYRRRLDIRHGTTLLDRLAPTKHTLFGLPAAKRIESELDARQLSIAALCPTTLLLAHLGQYPSLPANLFIVLPTAAGLRIVFLKDRRPVLTRLAPIVDDPKAQAEEILRTHRYLGNTRILPFGAPPPPVLLLGKSDDFATPLATARIDLIPPPAAGKKKGQDDWLPFLFDLAIRKQPYGQLAPLQRRIPWMSSHLRRMALTAAALALCTGLTAGAISLKTIFDTQGTQKADHEQSLKTKARLTKLEQEIATLKTTPEQVRRALELNDKEILGAPVFARQMEQLAHALAHALAHPSPLPAPLSQIEWQILPATATPCQRFLPAPTPDTPASETGEASPAVETDTTAPLPLKAEIALQITLPAQATPRAKADAVRQTSSRLTKIPGLTLIQDPAKTLDQGTLRGGNTANEGTDTHQTWCLTLPARPASTPSLPPQEKQP